MRLCDSCTADCGHQREANEVVVQCGAYRPPITNADHIRAMSDQELAAFLSGVCYGQDEPWEHTFKSACCDCCPTVEATDEYGKHYSLHECDFVDGVCPHGDSILWWLVRPQQVE